MATKKSLSSTSNRSKPGLSLNVVPEGNGWQVRAAGAERGSCYQTQADAVAAARERLRISGGEVRVHNSGGRVREALTLGRRVMSKISAVEGISLHGEIGRDLKAYDSERLSSEERRARIAAKYTSHPKK